MPEYQEADDPQHSTRLHPASALSAKEFSIPFAQAAMIGLPPSLHMPGQQRQGSEDEPRGEEESGPHGGNSKSEARNPNSEVLSRSQFIWPSSATPPARSRPWPA